MDEVITWLAWLSEPERRIVWAKSNRISTKKLSLIIGCHRNTIINRYNNALLLIATRLNADQKVIYCGPVTHLVAPQSQIG